MYKKYRVNDLVENIPGGKGANDLAQLALMTSLLSEITTDPSAAIPQKSCTL